MNTAYIYKITDGSNNYIGSTTKDINFRFKEHFYKYQNHLRGQYRYTSSFEIIKNGIETCWVELLEEYKYNTFTERLMREKEHILNNECVNIRTPLRSRKEYYEMNKEKIKAKQKEYYKKKKEMLNAGVLPPNDVKVCKNC